MLPTITEHKKYLTNIITRDYVFEKIFMFININNILKTE